MPASAGLSRRRRRAAKPIATAMPSATAIKTPATVMALASARPFPASAPGNFARSAAAMASPIQTPVLPRLTVSASTMSARVKSLPKKAAEPIVIAMRSATAQKTHRTAMGLENAGKDPCSAPSISIRSVAVMGEPTAMPALRQLKESISPQKANAQCGRSAPPCQCRPESRLDPFPIPENSRQGPKTSPFRPAPTAANRCKPLFYKGFRKRAASPCQHFWLDALGRGS